MSPQPERQRRMLVIGGDFFKRIFCKFEPESGKFMKAIWGASNRNSGRGQPTDPNPASYLKYLHVNVTCIYSETSSRTPPDLPMLHRLVYLY